MKIVCPSCAATYEVPESAVASKRAVRCARCGADWIPGVDRPHPTPAPAVTATPPAPEPEAEPAPEMEAATAPTVDETADTDLAAGVATPAPPAAPTVDETADTDLAAGVATPAPPAAPVGATPWHAVAAAIAAEAAANPAQPAKPRPPVAAWFVSVALLAILAASSVAFRVPIMKAWPASTRLYAALGLYSP